MRLGGNDDCAVCVCVVCNEAKRAIRFVGGAAIGYKEFPAWYASHAQHEHNFVPLNDLKRTSGWKWATDKDAIVGHSGPKPEVAED